MTEDEEFKCLKELRELGTSFSIAVPAPYGIQTFVVGPETLIKLRKDQAVAHAECYGVSKEDYLSWVEEEFSVRCAAKTAKGKRCKNAVEDGCSVEPKTWVEMQGMYCHVHEYGVK